MGPTVVSMRLIVGAKQALGIPRSAQLGAGLGIINLPRQGGDTGLRGRDVAGAGLGYGTPGRRTASHDSLCSREPELDQELEQHQDAIRRHAPTREHARPP
ncbi:hypothetical protein VTJ04DRAFT_9380 [Mycothermus thermophilus]|uniref:uncharacterized protein n=1 Tax=Humicola insolens TaxID=85995 RepID=UPI0037425D19